MEISISKKALFTALEAIELIENKELRDKELTSDDVLEIKWEIDLLETLAEIKNILYKTYPKDCFTR